jgi:hypothetical protein
MWSKHIVVIPSQRVEGGFSGGCAAAAHLSHLSLSPHTHRGIPTLRRCGAHSHTQVAAVSPTASPSLSPTVSPTVSPSHSPWHSHAAQVRRLYDIANILASLNVIEKTHLADSRKPAFKWLGAQVHALAQVGFCHRRFPPPGGLGYC